MLASKVVLEDLPPMPVLFATAVSSVNKTFPNLNLRHDVSDLRCYAHSNSHEQTSRMSLEGRERMSVQAFVTIF